MRAGLFRGYHYTAGRFSEKPSEQDLYGFIEVQLRQHFAGSNPA